MPFGFSLTSLAVAVLRHQLSTRKILAFALFSSILLFSALETTQLLLPSRVSNLTDIINNGLGGFFGGIFEVYR